MGNSYAERIASLKLKKDRLDKRLNTLEQKAKGERRKLETRQKIIVGGMVLAEMQKDSAFAERLRRLLKSAVTRPHDRAAIEGLLQNAPAAPVMKPLARVSMKAASSIAKKQKPRG